MTVFIPVICPDCHQSDAIKHGKTRQNRRYLARLKRQTLCYSKSASMLGYSVRLLMYYLRYKTIPLSTRINP